VTSDLIHCPNDVYDVPYRSSETCGDIDVIITRSVEDGKTHVGGYLLYVDGAAPGLYMSPVFVTY